MTNLPPDAIDSKVARRVIAAAMRMVETVIGEHFPEALDSLKAALAVAAVGCLTDNTQPTTLIFVARSGAGKTLVLSWLMPTDHNDVLAAYIYRSDEFTAASFVSHRADVKQAQLKRIDLLPRLKGKTLLTKELAPFFTGKQDDLMRRIAVVTAILDGQGFISDSGAHGRRGYVERINFQWLGATTPLSPEVLAIMAQLGPRLLFYWVDRPAKDTDALVALASRTDGTQAAETCREAVQNYLRALYTLIPPGSVHSSAVTFSPTHLRWLALWAQVLTALRTTVPGKGKEQDVAAEHAERALGILRNIATGSALVHGRPAVGDYDLAQVAHIAFSSGVAGRGRALRAVLTHGGTATTPEIEERARISTPTALRYMKELTAVGLAHFTEGKGTTPATVALVEPFIELCKAPLLGSADA